MALLTPKEKEHFEKKLFNNAAKDYLAVKQVSITNHPQKSARKLRKPVNLQTSSLNSVPAASPVC